ncbi:MAG: peroxiredoxin [Pseudomonadota bacterium]
MAQSAIKVGDTIPHATLMVATANGPEKADAAELMGAGKVAFFAVPGAFTPTCSAKHLPGFVSHADDLKAKGVDKIVCLSVNDAFVMQAWGESQNAGDAVTMAADGNGELAKAMGLEMDATGFGMGTRSQRFSGVAENGVVTHLFVEAPGAFEVSSAEHMLTEI